MLTARANLNALMNTLIIYNMKHELKEMMRAYDTYLDKVSRFIEATDESERYKLIAFDIIESQSIELERQLNGAEEVLTQYLEDQG